MNIYLNKELAYVLRQLLQIQPHSKMFSANFGDGQYLQPFADSIYTTSIAPDHRPLYMFYDRQEIDKIVDTDTDVESKPKQSDSPLYLYNYQTRVYPNPHGEHFNPPQKFHYGFTFPQFQVEDHWQWNTTVDNSIGSVSDETERFENPNVGKLVIPIVEDTMLFFESSKNPLSKERLASIHLVNMEQMFRAVMPGGYFAVVVPKNWIGNNMKYGKWWNDNVATVARINLPSDTVYGVKNCIIDKDIKWQLLVFMKPVARQSHRHRLLHAEFRYSAFMYTMTTLDEDGTAKLVKAFRKHDWWNKSIKLFNKMLEDQPYDREYGLRDSGPAELQDPRMIRIFLPNDRTRPGYKIAESTQQIQDDPRGIHIQPGPPVKCRAYHPVALSRLLDIQSCSKDIRIQAEGTKPAKVIDDFTESLRRKHFSSCKEELIKTIQEKGLVPYILATDIARMHKQEKWLAHQLAPLERCVQTTTSDDINEISWDWLYSDLSLQTMYPDLYRMWGDRARGMKMDKIAFDFQFDDIVRSACKQSLMLAPVMGLGKTLEALLTSYLRCVNRTLIVTPGRLQGIWIKELETNVANYVRRIKKNWMGQRIYADYQVIEWAEQCKPENLKTFNIISFERLTAIPRDAHFFKCSKCGFVVCSLFGYDRQPCPNPECTNFRRRQRANEINRIRGLRKYKTRGGYDIDERIHPEPAYLMDRMDYREKKLSRRLRGYEQRLLDDGHTVISVPEYDMVEKDVHLAWTFSQALRLACQKGSTIARERSGGRTSGCIKNIIVEEAVSIKNPNALRSKATNHLNVKHRMTLTGTPIRGYPPSILNLLNYTTKRSVFPDYRNEDEGSIARFLDKYGTYVKMEETGQRKLLPKVNNPEQFQAEFAPIILRHLREEPIVMKDIAPKHCQIITERMDMDEEHKEFYRKWLKEFTKWFIEKKKEEGKNARGGEIMVKLGYLANASGIPHSIFDSITKGKDVDQDVAAWAAVIGPYKGPPTAKQKRTWELIRKAQSQGDKVMVASRRRANLELGQRWAERQSEPPCYSMIVDGRTPNDKKHGMIEMFQSHEYNVLWAGLGAISEGFNIPGANWGIFMDYEWEPSVHKQFIGRMLRPQQEKMVYAYYLAHHGTVDEYMAAIAILKARSSDETIDYMEFDDLSVEMIPDVRQYAQAIVDGTDGTLKQRMWLAVEEITKHADDETEDWGDDE